MKITISTSNGTFTVTVQDYGDASPAREHAKHLARSVGSGAQVGEPFTLELSDRDEHYVKIGGQVTNRFEEKMLMAYDLVQGMRADSIVRREKEGY